MTFKRWKLGNNSAKRALNVTFFAYACSFFWGTRLSMYGIAHAYITHLDAHLPKNVCNMSMDNLKMGDSYPLPMHSSYLAC